MSVQENLRDLMESAGEKLQESAKAAGEKLPEIAKSASEKMQESAKAAGEKLQESAKAAGKKLSEIAPSPEPQVYSRLDEIPKGRASLDITPGCLVLEGGAFRGLYTQGVLDALMEAGINFQTTIGISAGALSGIGYVAGQIGWAARLNLVYRHNDNYIGLNAMKRDHGITGFSFMFEDAFQEHPVDWERFMDPSRRFLCVATNMNTGKPVYFEKGKCRDILRAVQASATVPYISRPVTINGEPYLDGGVVLNIPYHWAKRNRFPKIMVVKTRDREYRKEVSEHRRLNRLFYHSYPKMLRNMTYSEARYDSLLDEIDADEAAGISFVQAPERPVTISRFEGDMDRLGDLYWQGYHEMQKRIPDLKNYLKTEN